MGLLQNWLSPAVTAATNVAGAYQGAQAKTRAEQRADAIRQQQATREASQDRLREAIGAATMREKGFVPDEERSTNSRVALPGAAIDELAGIAMEGLPGAGSGSLGHPDAKAERYGASVGGYSFDASSPAAELERSKIGESIARQSATAARPVLADRALDVREQEGSANRAVRVSEGSANRDARATEGVANRGVRTSEGAANRGTRKDIATMPQRPRAGGEDPKVAKRQAWIATRARELARGGAMTMPIPFDQAVSTATQQADKLFGGAVNPPPKPAPPSGDVDLSDPATAGVGFPKGGQRPPPPVVPDDVPTDTPDHPGVAAAVERINAGKATLAQLEASGKSPEFKAEVRRLIGGGVAPPPVRPERTVPSAAPSTTPVQPPRVPPVSDRGPTGAPRHVEALAPARKAGASSPSRFASSLATGGGGERVSVTNPPKRILPPAAVPLPPPIDPTTVQSAAPLPEPIAAAIALAAPRVPSETVREVLQQAESLLGLPYQWGGDSVATGYDCSALVREVFGKNGIELPRTTAEQIQKGRTVNLAETQPGDLLFFDADKGDGTVDHVAIYAGNNRVLHASSSGGGVRYDDLDSERGKNLISHLLTVRRVVASDRERR